MFKSLVALYNQKIETLWNILLNNLILSPDMDNAFNVLLLNKIKLKNNEANKIGNTTPNKNRKYYQYE